MNSNLEHPRDRWNDMVVPAAKGLEKFFWNLAWFAVVVVLLFGGTCITRSALEGDSHREQRQTDPAGSEQVSDLQQASESGK